MWFYHLYILFCQVPEPDDLAPSLNDSFTTALNDTGIHLESVRTQERLQTVEIARRKVQDFGDLDTGLLSDRLLDKLQSKLVLSVS